MTGQRRLATSLVVALVVLTGCVAGCTAGPRMAQVFGGHLLADGEVVDTGQFPRPSRDCGFVAGEWALLLGHCAAAPVLWLPGG